MLSRQHADCNLSSRLLMTLAASCRTGESRSHRTPPTAHADRPRHCALRLQRDRRSSRLRVSQQPRRWTTFGTVDGRPRACAGMTCTHVRALAAPKPHSRRLIGVKARQLQFRKRYLRHSLGQASQAIPTHHVLGSVALAHSTAAVPRATSVPLARNAQNLAGRRKKSLPL
jgi:hypothetical protein